MGVPLAEVTRGQGCAMRTPGRARGRCLGGGAHREGVRRVRGVGELELGRVACQACAGPREREREKTLMGVGGGWMACGGAAVALLSCQKVVWPVAASVAYPPHPCGWPVVVVPRWPAVVMACPPARLPAWPHHLRATLLSARHYGTPPPPPPLWVEPSGGGPVRCNCPLLSSGHCSHPSIHRLTVNDRVHGHARLAASCRIGRPVADTGNCTRHREPPVCPACRYFPSSRACC